MIPNEVMKVMEYKDFKKLQKYIQKYADVIEIIEYGNECRWDHQFISPDDLVKILLSDYLTEESKKKVSDYYNYRETPQYYKDLKDQEKQWEQSKKTKTGYVYLLHAPSLDAYKIGKAKDVDARIKAFSIEMPMEIQCVFTAKSSEYDVDEKKLHKLFEEKRLIGEWFRLDNDDVNCIKNYSFAKEANNENLQ